MTQVLLLDVVDAGGAHAAVFGSRQGRQQQPGKNGDDRNDHQQFDEGEGGKECSAFGFNRTMNLLLFGQLHTQTEGNPGL